MNMQTHKLIAPVIITAVTGAYYIVIGITGGIAANSIVLRLLSFVVPAFIVGSMIYILIERIKEIRSGEEDDLGKY
ncbi:MAG: hypothetical protein LBB61_10635 [Treponema sp.]|jgi:hypothetical protein|nr:hypothetical protein [Treponema sp.]